MYAIDPEEYNIGKHQDQLDNDKNIFKLAFWSIIKSRETVML